MTSHSFLVYARSGPEIGLGHVVRCGHLARELVSLGAEVTMALWENEPTLRYYRGLGGLANFHILKGDEPDAVIVASRVEEPSVVVLDMMDAAEALVLGLKAEGRKVVVIVGNGWTITDVIKQAADLLIYQSAVVPAALPGTALFGLRHLILGPEYTISPTGKRTIPALIAMGGGIEPAWTSEIAACLSRRGIEGTIVLGGHLWPRAAMVDTRFFSLVRAPLGLSALQAESEVCIGSLGMATYECLAMGAVPVLVGRSLEHVATANVLQAMGVARSIGWAQKLEPQYVADVAMSLLGDRAQLDSMHNKARGLVDGHGARRVAECLLRL